MSNILTYKYFVAEDESLIRKNLIKKITALNLPLTLVGESANGMDAIVQIEKLCPNLVITDIKMPQCDGLELSSYLQKNHPSIQTIILSGFNDFNYAQTAIKYGVKDYLLKPIDEKALSASLHKVLLSFQSASEQLESFVAGSNKLDQKSICELIETYLQEHYQNDISFQELADHFGFTIEYIGKIFKKQTGETPLKYLTKIRMNEAKRLLLQNPDLEIQKVGELVGYKDAFYFSRAFKTYTGIQPSEFRGKI